MTQEYKYVPVEPTPEMIDEGRNRLNTRGFDTPEDIYKAMISAVPADPLDQINGLEEALLEISSYRGDIRGWSFTAKHCRDIALAALHKDKK